jgi:uncharacterized membrane protein
MTPRLLLIAIALAGCTLPAEREAKKAAAMPDSTTTIQSSDTNLAARETAIAENLPPTKKLKSPGGIYQAVLPLNGQMQQTIAFYKDYSYQLEEKYISNTKKDSIVRTQGTWSPSDGFIWLYKDQVVRGRYSWQDDTLQYFSPVLKRSFSMRPLQDALQTPAWQNKKREGVIVFGTGTEPFWSIEYNNTDTLSFLLSEWDHPVKMKISSSFNTKDSTGYKAQNDSARLQLTVLPYFCSDGMSDLIYRNKIRVQYNGHTYNGCGIRYQ